jgi:nicotinamidase-related amidase
MLMPRLCVLVVDMLYEFVRGRLRSPQAEAIVPNIVKIVEKARERKVPVVHLVDAHLPVDIEVREIWGHHAMKGSPEARIIPELEPKTELEFVLEKRWYSGFRGTGLTGYL